MRWLAWAWCALVAARFATLIGGQADAATALGFATHLLASFFVINYLMEDR